jgi:pimeloyl-ACP methyl ester carboxylesterase
MSSIRIFTYKNSPVSYYRYGSGKNVLVAFHGFDQSGSFYQYFEDTLGKHFTIIAIDFFWHGQSKWQETEDFTETDMREIVIGIAAQEKLFARKFSVMSFSMGARMARALVRTFPERIEHLILVSPPTFAFNRFLNFTTGTAFGRWMFRYFLKHNHQLLAWAERLHKMKILNRSVYVFTSKFISNKSRLEKVYRTWMSQKRLRTNFTTFAKLMDKHAIHLILIAGKNDKLTPPHSMIKYVRKLKKRNIYLLPKKHELQTPETRHVLSKLFGL